MRLSDTEWTAMNVVWEQSPASARDVLERVAAETGWAYTTVKTILNRLVEKGALQQSKRGHTSFYQPLITQEQARRSAVRSLLERAFDGALGSLLQHLVAKEKLSKKDRARLAAMLEELDRETERKP